jgi:hypothetical protein
VTDRPTALLSYDPAIDSLYVSLGDAPSLDIDSIVEDLNVLFDAARSGGMVGVHAVSPNLGRSPGWRAVLRDCVGETVLQASDELARGGVPVYEKPVTIPHSELVGLLEPSWRVLHRCLRQKQGLEPLPEPESPVAGGFGVTLYAPAPAHRVNGEARLPGPVNLPIAAELASAWGVRGEVCAAYYRDWSRLDLRLDLENPGRAPRLEAVLASPGYARGRFEARGAEAVASLELTAPLSPERLGDLVVHLECADSS